LEGACGETEAVKEEIGGSHKVCVVVVCHIDEVRFTPSVITDIEAVDVELDFIGRGRECAIHSRVRRCEILHGVVEREFLGQCTRSDILLDLGDEKVMFARRDVTTLLVIEIVVVGVALYVVV